MRARYIVPVVLMSGAALLAQTRPATQRSRPPEPARPTSRDFSQRYSVLIENNIFLRERGRAASPSQPPREPTTRPATTAPSPEQSFALLGVVFEGEDFRAYFESLGDSTIVRVEPGDALARGRVVEMQADAIAYESDGRVIWIEVGQDLTGSLSRSASASTQPADSATQPAGTAGGANDVLERMRQRRRQLMIGQ